MKKLRTPLKTSLEIILVMALLITSIFPALSCGSSTAEVVEAVSLDFSGGIVEDADQKAKVAVPMGALTEDNEISINSTEAPVLTNGMSTLGDAYEFGPVGTTFDQAVTVTLNYEESELPEGVTPADLLLCIVSSDGSFTPLDNIRVDTEAGTISGDTTHFSIIAATYIEGETGLEVFPGKLNFGDVLINTTATGTVTVANPTSSDILITRLQVAPFAGEWVNSFASLFPAFSVAGQNQLPITVAAGDKQEISVSFSPLVAGPYQADLLVSTVDATMRIPLNGQGVLSIGLLEIVPNFHDYGAVRLEPAPADTKKATFSVINNTDLDVQINAVQVSTFPFSTGSFTLEGPSPAGTTLKSMGGVAALQAAYTPQTKNMEFGYILLQGTDSKGNPAGVVCLLQGRGISGVDVKITSLDFGRVLVGTTKTLNTTITNTGSADFAQTGYATSDWDFWPFFPPAWVAPLAVGQSATGAINFTPQKRGPYNAVVRAAARIGTGWIYDDATLMGIGVDSRLTINPWDCNFWGVCLGETKEIAFTITNVGDFDVTVSQIRRPNNPFGVVNAPTVGTILHRGQSHTSTATFSPVFEDVYDDFFGIEVDFTYDGKVYTDTYFVDLWGIGTACQGEVGISIKPSIDFGDVLVGTEEEKTTTIWNDSEEVFNIFAGKSKPMVFDATYSVEGGGSVFNPSTPQQAGIVGFFFDSTEEKVTFKPRERGTFDGTIKATGKVNGKPVQATASVMGRGVDTELTADPDPIDFGKICGGESKDIRVTITNTGDFDLVVTDYDFPTSPYEVVSTIPQNLALAKGASYEYNIRFTPPDEATYHGRFNIYVEFEYRGEKIPQKWSFDLVGEGEDCGPKPWEVYISALNMSFITVPPCSCPTWPSCGCGPGSFSFTAMLTVLGDDPEPMPGATVTVRISGPGIDSTRTLTTNGQGQAFATFTGSTNGEYTIEVVDITGEYDDREMNYNPDNNVVSEVSKSAP